MEEKIVAADLKGFSKIKNIFVPFRDTVKALESDHLRKIIIQKVVITRAGHLQE